MLLERTIQSEINESVMLERITAYLQKAGYRLLRSEPPFVFRRGSLLGSFTSFSPRGWKVKATVEISPGNNQCLQSTIILDIDTTGQWVTDSERTFWQNELDGLEKSIFTGDIDIGVSAQKANFALVQNLLSMLLIAALAGMMAFGGRFLSCSRIIAYSTGALGTVVGLYIAHRWLHFRIGG